MLNLHTEAGDKLNGTTWATRESRRWPMPEPSIPTLTTAQAVVIGIPRWMVLAMPDDVTQIAHLAEIEYATPAQRSASRRYYIRELRRTQWERRPCKPARKPSILRPSKRTDGYRNSASGHSAARMKLTPERRSEIARIAGRASAAKRKG